MERSLPSDNHPAFHFQLKQDNNFLVIDRLNRLIQRLGGVCIDFQSLHTLTLLLTIVSVDTIHPEA